MAHKITRIRKPIDPNEVNFAKLFNLILGQEILTNKRYEQSNLRSSWLKHILDHQIWPNVHEYICKDEIGVLKCFKVEEIEHPASKLDDSGQPDTSGVKEGEISLRPQKGPKRVDTNNTGVKSCWFFNNTWENLLKGMEFRPEHFITDVSGKYPRLWVLKGASPNDVRRWYNFGALASIRTIAPGFREILELPD
ncbi:hypothetical protein ACS0TY_014531 [Phlomoides rotata]